MRLEAKTFLVTGGRSGLGAAVVAMLASAGAAAVVADLPDCDVTDEAAVEELVARSHELHGVVCCAGIGGSARILDFEAERVMPPTPRSVHGGTRRSRRACRW